MIYLVYKGTGDYYITEELYAIADSLECARRFTKQIESDTSPTSIFGWAIKECQVNKLIYNQEEMIEESSEWSWR